MISTMIWMTRPSTTTELDDDDVDDERSHEF